MLLIFFSISTEHYRIHILHSSTLDLYFLEGAALGTEHEVPQTEFSESTGYVPSAVWLFKTAAIFDIIFSAHLDGHTREKMF